MNTVYEARSDQKLLEQLGERIRQIRLTANLTQAELATRSGLAIRTVQNLENGKNPSLVTLVRALRALGALQYWDQFLPEPGPSPLQLIEMQGKERQRATGSRVKQDPNAKDWSW